MLAVVFGLPGGENRQVSVLCNVIQVGGESIEVFSKSYEEKFAIEITSVLCNPRKPWKSSPST